MTETTAPAVETAPVVAVPEFAAVEIPKSGAGRKKGPNEYLTAVANLVPNSGALRTPPIPNGEVSKHVGRLNAAGKEAGFTVGKFIEVVAGTETSTITFWTKPKIVKRKSAPAETVEAAPVETSETSPVETAEAAPVENAEPSTRKRR